MKNLKGGGLLEKAVYAFVIINIIYVETDSQKSLYTYHNLHLFQSRPLHTSVSSDFQYIRSAYAQCSYRCV